MRFKAKTAGGDRIVIESPTYFDAHQFAQRHFADLRVARTAMCPDSIVADYELRWLGVDLNGGHRKLQYRTRGQRKWRDVDALG